MTLRACTEPGCPALVDRGACPRHARRWRARDAVSPSRRGYGTAYRRARAALLGLPCAWCGAPSDTADHLVPVALGGEGSGLVPACRRCNSARGRRLGAALLRGPERGGGGAARPEWRGRHLVVLMGAPGSGKSTWARASGLPVVSTDAIRASGGRGAEVADGVYEAAWERVAALLRDGLPVVLDSPAVHPAVRARALRIARAYHARATLVVVDAPLAACIARQAGREHPAAPEVVARYHARAAVAAMEAASEGWSAVVRDSGESRGMAGEILAGAVPPCTPARPSFDPVRIVR